MKREEVAAKIEMRRCLDGLLFRIGVPGVPTPQESAHELIHEGR